MGLIFDDAMQATMAQPTQVTLPTLREESAICHVVGLCKCTRSAPGHQSVPKRCAPQATSRKFDAVALGLGAG